MGRLLFDFQGSDTLSRMQPDNLWAPWRMAYIKQMDPQSEGHLSESQSVHSCFLCEAAKTAVPGDEAKQRLILLHDDRGVILLNKYPYSNGHLLIAPAQHIADLDDLTPTDRAGLMELTVVAERLLRSAINPQGLNIGMNLGRCAGAGLPGHLHIHVVPRWGGDTNFMQTVGHVRVIPQAIEESYLQLAQALDAIGEV